MLIIGCFEISSLALANSKVQEQIALIKSQNSIELAYKESLRNDFVDNIKAELNDKESFQAIWNENEDKYALVLTELEEINDEEEGNKGYKYIVKGDFVDYLKWWSNLESDYLYLSLKCTEMTKDIRGIKAIGKINYR